MNRFIRSCVLLAAVSVTLSQADAASLPSMKTSAFLKSHLGDLSQLDKNPANHGVQVTPSASFKALKMAFGTPSETASAPAKVLKKALGTAAAVASTPIVVVTKAVVPNFKRTGKLDFNLHIDAAIASYESRNIGVLDANANTNAARLDNMLRVGGDEGGLTPEGVNRNLVVSKAETKVQAKVLRSTARINSLAGYKGEAVRNLGRSVGVLAGGAITRLATQLTFKALFGLAGKNDVTKDQLQRHYRINVSEDTPSFLAERFAEIQAQ